MRMTLGAMAFAAAVLVLAAGAMAAGGTGVLSGSTTAAGPLDKISKDAQAAKVEPVVIRMYNVQDLTLGRDYPYRSAVMPPTSVDPYSEGAAFGLPVAPTYGTFGAGGAAAAPSSEEATLSSSMTPQVIADLVHRAIDPTSWTDEGGRGKIDRVGALLVVTQTAENHKKIAELIDQLRTARPMVTVEARWILLDDDQVAKIIPEDATKRTVPQEVTAAALKEAGATVIYRGLITCFDRQTVHLASGRGQTVMANITPVVGEAAVGLSPETSLLLWGVLMEVTPALAADAKSVTLRVHSLVTEPLPMRTKTIQAESPSDKGTTTTRAEVDLPEFLLHTFRTAMRLPVNKGVLIGGATAPKAADGKVLYLFLQVTASKPEAK